MAKRFKDLTEREILALGIQLEEEDSRVYGDFAEGLRESYPATARVFEEMQAEESRHRQVLIDIYRKRFGEHIPLIRRQDVKGFPERRPVWLVRPLGISVVRKQAEIMELETRRFYERAQERVTDASVRKLLGDLAEAERKHQDDERLERENAWRSARDVKPVKALDEIKDDATASILLDEAAQIAGDLAVATAHRAAPTQARRTDLH